MEFEHGDWIDNDAESMNIKRIRGRVKSVCSNNKYANVVLLNDRSSTEIKLLNKSSEILASGDYVIIEYSNIFSSKTACIIRRNGTPRFTGYYVVKTQTEYDALEADGKIEDDMMYVIVGD